MGNPGYTFYRYRNAWNDRNQFGKCFNAVIEKYFVMFVSGLKHLAFESFNKFNERHIWMNNDEYPFFICEAIEAKNADSFFCDGKAGETPHYETSTVHCKCNAHLTISGYSIYIPVVYLFDHGISMHLCIQIDLDTVHEYMQKWFDVSSSLKHLVRRTNPLIIKTLPSVIINQIPLDYNHRSETYWIPGAQAYHMSTPPEGELLLQQYNLDSKKAWLFQKIQCPWNKSDMSKIETIQFRLSLRCPSILGPKISNFKINRNHCFYRPGFDMKHYFTILSCKTKIANQCSSPMVSCGKFMTEICYSVSPNREESPLEIVCLDNLNEQRTVGCDDIRTTVRSASSDIKSPNHYTTCLFHDKPIEEVELQLLLLGVEQYAESEVMKSAE